MTADLHLDEVEAEFRRRRTARFDPAVLLWLAALPEWTDRRAGSTGFPPGGEALADLLDRLHAAGLLARRADVAADGELLTAFWLPASRRAEVGAHLRARLTPTALLDGLRALATALRSLPDAEVAEVLPWLETVERHLDDASGAGLLARVDGLVVDGRAADALGIVSAAQALGDVLGEPLTSSARRAQWRIDRGHRQALDARTVVNYLPHPEVDAALRALLGSDAPSWAVHLLGNGGVGKTMAVRDLASGRFAARSGLPQPVVARVDFDHLDPRYPYGRPAELLLALVGELFTYSSTREAESAFRASDDALSYVHEMVGTTPGGPDLRLVEAAVDTFADYINDLDDVVVLVLDTCEELAKLHPPGGRAPAVDHTFAMLERLHARAPRMRVLLAGRRWLVPPPSSSASGGLVLDPRPYLTVVPIGGFSLRQAGAYLDRRDARGSLDAPLRDAVLARCTRSADDRGINPYDLACYCDWALAEPDLDPVAIRTASGDPYVEQRILARLPSAEVRDCLPAAAELGRFDRSMIAPALARRGIDVDAAFSGLAGQEWVSAVTFNRDGRPDVVEIDAQLRPRLRAVLAAHPDRYPHDPAVLGADLRALVESAPLPELPVEAVEAALRLLPVDAAGAMWARFETRVVETRRWDWALQAVTRAAAVEQIRAAGDGPTVQAAVLATQAAANLRFPSKALAGPLWRQVVELADRHPDPALVRTLRFRGLCGLLAAGVHDVAAAREVADLWARARGSLPFDSLLAALDADLPDDVLEALPEPAAPQSVPADLVGPVLVAFADRFLRSADVDRCLDAAVRAEAEARVENVDPQDRWPDYLPPRRPVERARLGVLLAELARCEPPEEARLRAWRDAALPHIADIDAERLVSATLTLELAWRPVPSDALMAARAADVYAPQRVPTHPWHHRVPPLCLAVARALAAAGDAPAAGEWLRRRREDAVGAGDDPGTIHLCERELAELSRAYRSLAFSTAVPRMVERVDAAGDAAWAALALLRGEGPETPAQTTTPHAWWRVQLADSGRAAAVLGDRGLDELLDLVEAALLGGSGVAAAREAAEAAFNRAHRYRPGIAGPSALADILRAEALLDPPPAVGPVLEGLPPRLLAETAAAEGELLALRLPSPALALLDRAVRAFRAAGDEAGAARAAILRVLTAGRAGVVGDALDPHGWSDGSLPDRIQWSGWPVRSEQARRVLASTPLSSDDASPELRARARPPLRAGNLFGNYELREPLGTGTRWRAYDLRRERLVHIEILPSSSGDAQWRSRFQREMRVVASLREPHVLPVHDYGEIDGRLFVDTRLVEGDGRVDAVIAREGRLPPERATDIAGQVAAALDSAHAEGLVHGDVRPGQVITTSGEFVYLAGTGTVRPLTSSSLTLTAASPSSKDLRIRLLYAAPELFTNDRTDARTDVYALTCLLYEMLTGEPPFTGEIVALMQAHLGTPPPRPSAVRTELPAALDAVVARGMAKDPAERFASAGAFAEAVRAAMSRQHSAASADPWAVPPVRSTSPPADPWAVPPVGSTSPPADPFSIPRAGSPAPTPAGPSSAPVGSPRDLPTEDVRPRRLWPRLVLGAVAALAVLAALWAIGPAAGEPPPGGRTGASTLWPVLAVVLVVLAIGALVGAIVVYLGRRRRATPAPDEKPVTASTPSMPVPPVGSPNTPTASAPPRSTPVTYNARREGDSVVLAPGSAAGGSFAVLPTADPDAGSGAPPTVVALVGRQPQPKGARLRWRLPPAVVAAPGRGRLAFRGPALMRPGTATLVAAGPRACLHVVGTAVETRAGWRVRLRDAETTDEGADPWTSTGSSSTYSDYGWAQQTRGTFSGETLLGPDDLGATPCALVVLQAEPAMSGRAAAQTHHGMRAVAAELVAGGMIGAVLVVPSTVDSRAQAAVNAVAAAVSGWGHPAHPLDLLQVTVDVQKRTGDRALLYANTEQERTA